MRVERSTPARGTRPRSLSGEQPDPRGPAFDGYLPAVRKRRNVGALGETGCLTTRSEKRESENPGNEIARSPCAAEALSSGLPPLRSISSTLAGEGTRISGSSFWTLFTLVLLARKEAAHHKAADSRRWPPSNGSRTKWSRSQRSPAVTSKPDRNRWPASVISR